MSQHLSISNGSTQVDASFMQTLWNIQPTCSSGNMAVGEEAPRVVHPRAFTLAAPHLTRFTDRLPDRRTRDASLSRPRRELDHPVGGEQRGDAEVSSKTQSRLNMWEQPLHN